MAELSVKEPWWEEISFHWHNIDVNLLLSLTGTRWRPTSWTCTSSRGSGACNQRNEKIKRSKRFLALDNQPTVWWHALLVSCQITETVPRSVSLSLRGVEICKKKQKKQREKSKFIFMCLGLFSHSQAECFYLTLRLLTRFILCKHWHIWKMDCQTQNWGITWLKVFKNLDIDTYFYIDELWILLSDHEILKLDFMLGRVIGASMSITHHWSQL